MYVVQPYLPLVHDFYPYAEQRPNIGMAGIALSVGGVNQYCLLRWPVPVHFMISEAPVYTVAQKLYVSVWYHQPGAWAEVSEFLGVASLRSGMWWREAPYTLLYYIYVGDDCVARCRMLKNAQEYEECAKCEYCA